MFERCVNGWPSHLDEQLTHLLKHSYDNMKDVPLLGYHVLQHNTHTAEQQAVACVQPGGAVHLVVFTS